MSDRRRECDVVWYSHGGRNASIMQKSEPDRQWRSSSFQESKKVRVSRDLWPWPWPWAHPGCTMTWSPSCASLVVVIRQFVCEKKRFAQKFTDRQTDDGRRAIALAHSWNELKTENTWPKNIAPDSKYKKRIAKCGNNEPWNAWLYRLTLSSSWKFSNSAYMHTNVRLIWIRSHIFIYRTQEHRRTDRTQTRSPAVAGMADRTAS